MSGLHKISAGGGTPQADVIFVHGLDDDPFAGLEAARARHARHYCGVLATTNRFYLKGGEGVVAGLALYDLEQRNIAAGQSWATARAERDDEAARLTAEYPSTGGHILHLRLAPAVMIGWCQRAAEAAARVGDKPREANAAGNLGLLHQALGGVREGIVWHERYLELAREIGDRRGEGNALDHLGIAWKNLGEPRRAIELFEQQLATAREIGDRSGEGLALFNSARALDALGERAKAVGRTQAALAIFVAIGANHRAANVRAQLEDWGVTDGRD